MMHETSSGSGILSTTKGTTLSVIGGSTGATTTRMFSTPDAWITGTNWGRVTRAVADALTGLTAAVTVADLLERGGRWIVDVALSRVAACAASRVGDPVVDALADARSPHAATGDLVPVPLGRDTHDVLAEWGS
jgi:hypothetical protein